MSLFYALFNALQQLNKSLINFISTSLFYLQSKLGSVFPNTSVRSNFTNATVGRVGGSDVMKNPAKQLNYLTQNSTLNLVGGLNLNLEYKTLLQYLTSIIHSIRLRSFSFGFYYIQGFVFLLFIDACLTDDEPLWEPIE